jgi:hypothetical protein
VVEILAVLKFLGIVLGLLAVGVVIIAAIVVCERIATRLLG